MTGLDLMDREAAEAVILDHHERPRHFGGLEGATHQAEGYDPFCGDKYTVRVAAAQGRIEAAAFEGFGCAVSRASGSILTGLVRDLDVDQALQMAAHIEAVFLDGLEPRELGELAALLAIREQPSRAKCVLLPWRALRAALRAS